MLDPSKSRFWQATVQSGLADTDALQKCWEALPGDKREAEHLERRLARQAVQSGLLTLWQAQQLMAGRSGGFKIDRYVLAGLIGQGGMGRVYLARDTRLNRRVALKILSTERMNNPRAKKRFHREAMVGAQLQHENLVRIYDEGEDDGKCYLVMEYIEGKNIGQMIAENGPVPPSVAARLARQVALGLEHAQRKGLIHRDVNPYNILVTRDGVAKLTDLGLAIDLADIDHVTRDGATVGTFDYISPEQARRSHDADTRSDVYSLGCTLYHMLAGNVPFPTPSLPEKLWSHQAGEPGPLPDAVPEGLANVVARAMRKLPEERFATPQDFAQALEPFSTDLDETSAVLPTAADDASTPRQAASVTRVTTALPTPPPSAAAEPSTVVATSLPTTDVPANAAVEDQGSGDDFSALGLSVDLGPAPPLSAAPKSPPKPKPAPNPKADASGNGSGFPPWLIPAAAGLLLIAGGFLVYRNVGGAGTTTSKKAKADTGTGGKVAKSLTSKAKSSTGPAKLVLPTTKGKEVVVVDGDGEMSVEPDLANGMRAAIGARGYVLLASPEPLTFVAADSATVSGGRLEIRAAEGSRPVLRVEVKGRTPFLTTRTDTPLKLVGVTIEAKAVDPGPEPAPVIEAGGSVTLDRCAFTLDTAAPVPGSTAVRLEGMSMTASGCWFENFDRAIDLACFGGSTSTVSHSMFVSNRPPSEESVGTGWAVRLRNMPGGQTKTGRKLVLDHDTVRGQGFVAFDEFSAAAPIKVSLNACAVLADGLIAWRPDLKEPEGKPTREAMAWSGKGDLMDIRGKGWVLLAPAKGGALTPMPEGPADRAAWTATLGDEETPVTSRLKFASEGAASSARPTPADFALTGLDSKPPGADPDLVGPGAKPIKR